MEEEEEVLLFPIVFLLSAVAAAFPAIGLDLAYTRAADSCSATTVGVRVGRTFNTPGPIGLIVRPEGQLRSLPCTGFGLSAGGRVGVRGGPVQGGMYLFGGPTISGRKGDFDFNGTLGGFVDILPGPLEVGIHGAWMSGYLDRGWLDIGIHGGLKF